MHGMEYSVAIGSAVMQCHKIKQLESLTPELHSLLVDLVKNNDFANSTGDTSDTRTALVSLWKSCSVYS